MDLKLRPGRPEDAAACGDICYEAFGSIARAHHFPSDFPAPEVAAGLMSMLFDHPGFYSVVAEMNGIVVGETLPPCGSSVIAIESPSCSSAEMVS